MPRPPGRRTWYKIALHDSELEALLEFAPEGTADIQRVAQLCRSVARGEYSLVPTGRDPGEPVELVKARAQKNPRKKGRTPCARQRSDILLFPREFDAFMERAPKGLTFQETLRQLASGALRLAADTVGTKMCRTREDAGRCLLCGEKRQDSGEYCRTCRGVEVAA